MTKSVLEQIKEDEGFKGIPYKCSKNKTTIGYGRNLESNPLTRSEAEFLLQNDIERVQKQAMRFSFYKNLTPERRGVILNMIFNLGAGGFCKFKKMITALENKNYALAADEMLDSDWAGQVGDRAIRLSKIMRNHGEQLNKR